MQGDNQIVFVVLGLLLIAVGTALFSPAASSPLKGQSAYNTSVAASLSKMATSHSHYYALEAPSDHRAYVGGAWDEIGQLELTFMKSMGLNRSHHLLDVGCGALRGGIHFIQYLHPAHYYGIDLNPQLLEAGYARRLAERACPQTAAL